MNSKHENIRKMKAIEKKNKEKLIAINPDLSDESGIYILLRTDENGIKYAYVGQSVKVLSRLTQHMVGYQHIDLSIKKHGWYRDDNIYGWRVGQISCPSDNLDFLEKYYITQYAKFGYQLRNKTAGGQGKGKIQIDEYRPSKTYRQGVSIGRKKASKECYGIFDKHLNFNVKKEGNKTQEKAMEKFKNFLEEWKNE